MDLKKAIKAHGWTISAIAEKLGITQSALSQTLGNETMPISRLQVIANIMGISVSELVAGDNDQQFITCPNCGAKLELKEKCK